MYEAVSEVSHAVGYDPELFGFNGFKFHQQALMLSGKRLLSSNVESCSTALPAAAYYSKASVVRIHWHPQNAVRAKTAAGMRRHTLHSASQNSGLAAKIRATDVVTGAVFELRAAAAR